MSDTKDTVFYIRVDKDLGDKIRTEAHQRGHNISGFIRWVLRQWVDADAVTVEQNTLTDPKADYDAGCCDA